MPYLTISENRKWYYEVKGEGQCLLFIHGWASSGRVFSQQIEYFSKDYKVVVVDLPGHGNTPWQTMSLEDMAKDIGLLAESLGEKEIFVVGSSLGGMVGLKCAELSKSPVKKLVMVGSLPRFLKTQQRPLGLMPVEMARLQKQLRERYPAILDIFFRSLFTLEERETQKFKWIHQFQKSEKSPDKEALESLLDMLSKADLTDFLTTTHIPILFLAGEKDYICSPSSLAFLKDIIPDAQYDIIKDSGHFPFIIHSQEFNEKVERFLDLEKV